MSGRQSINWSVCWSITRLFFSEEREKTVKNNSLQTCNFSLSIVQSRSVFKYPFHNRSFTIFLSWAFFHNNFSIFFFFLAICLLQPFFDKPFFHNLCFQPLFFNLCKTSDASFSARGLVLCLLIRQISGWCEELGAQYSHPKTYSGLALPRLGQGE